MNEELTKKLIEWIENLGNIAGDELPSFVQEIAAYGVGSSLICAAVFFIIFVSLLTVSIMCFKHKKDDLVGLGAFLFFVSIFPFAFMFWGINESIKATYAPRLYAIEQLRGR